MALPAATIDVTGSPVTRADFTGAGFTETGTPANDASGVILRDNTTDGYYKAYTEQDGTLLIECTVAALPAVTGLGKIIGGLHVNGGTATASFDEVFMYRNIGNQRGLVGADGAATFSPDGAPAFVTNIGDVIRVLVVAAYAGAPRFVAVFAKSPLIMWGGSDPAAASTTRDRIAIGGAANAALGSNFKSAPIALTRFRFWNSLLSGDNIALALAGDPDTFTPGNSATVTTAPVLAFSAKGATTITIDITHAADATGAVIHYRDNRPGSAWIRFTNNPVVAATAQIQITELTPNETYLIIAEPYDDSGSIGLASSILVVPLDGNEARY